MGRRSSRLGRRVRRSRAPGRTTRIRRRVPDRGWVQVPVSAGLRERSGARHSHGCSKGAIRTRCSDRSLRRAVLPALWRGGRSAPGTRGTTGPIGVVSRADTIALGTRAARTPVDPIGLKNEWLTRADRVGLDIDACFDRATRSVAYERLPAEPERPLFDDLVNRLRVVRPRPPRSDGSRPSSMPPRSSPSRRRHAIEARA
jgi:hypothetical protein